VWLPPKFKDFGFLQGFLDRGAEGATAPNFGTIVGFADISTLYLKIFGLLSENH